MNRQNHHFTTNSDCDWPKKGWSNTCKPQGCHTSFFSDNQGAPCAGWAPRSSCALYLRTITRDLMWRTGVTPRFSVAHRVFFLVAGQLRVTLLVRLTQCVQPMVGVTRYDLPVVDVILERPFTGYSGGRALVLQNHWGTLVGAPYWCQKQTERDRFAVDEMQVDWLSLRDYKQQNEWTTNKELRRICIFSL